MDTKQEPMNFEEKSSYRAVLKEVLNGNFETFLKWESKIPEIVIEHFYEKCFLKALDSQQEDMLNYILMHPIHFRDIENYYSDCTHPFVDRRILELKQQKLLFESTTPGISFDLKQRDEILSCFYYARNLIRRKDFAQQDDLLFLLNIPSVQALIHTEVTPDRPNELMHLAILVNNVIAEKTLIQIFSEHFIDEFSDFNTLRKKRSNTKFDYILQLAKENDLEGLQQVPREYYGQSRLNGFSPAEWLAKEGDYASVELLTEVFQLDRDNLVDAYAFGGQVEQVSLLLSQGASPDHAAYGYAASGYFDKLDPNAKSYALLNGYARGGHFQKARALLIQDVDPDSATEGFAMGGYFREVNQQIAAGANKKAALLGYSLGGYLHADNILRVMVVTDNDELRRMLAEKFGQRNEALDMENLYQQATRLNQKLWPGKEEPWDPQDLFNRVYQYAREANEKALDRMVKDGICLGIFIDLYSPLKMLARDGQHEAVNLLINKFHGNAQDAIAGYAEGGFFGKVELMLAEEDAVEDAAIGYIIGGFFEKADELLTDELKKKTRILRNYARKGHVEAVKKLIKDNKDRSNALYGYILGGYIAEANQLLLEGANPGDAVEAYAFLGQTEEVNKLITLQTSAYALKGYARSGNEKQVNLMLPEEVGGYRKGLLGFYCQRGYAKLAALQLTAGSDLNIAVKSYAFSGYIHQVNELIKAGAGLKDAMEGYAAGDFLNGKIKPLLRLMVFTDNLELRTLLGMEAKKKNAAIEPEILLAKALKINKLMSLWSLDFRESLFWVEQTPGELIWILQGCQLVQNQTLLPELFWLITYFLLNLPMNSTVHLVSAINRDVLPERALSGFFSQRPQEGKVEAILDRYII